MNTVAMEARLPITQNRTKITLQNFREFKPSFFIRSAIDDVKLVLARGININMDDFYDGVRCTVCLAGAKLLCMTNKIDNFLLEKNWPYNIVSDSYDETKVIDLIENLFDAIRCADIILISASLSRLYNIEEAKFKCALYSWYEDYSTSFTGPLNSCEIKSLISSIEYLSISLENAGY